MPELQELLQTPEAASQPRYYRLFDVNLHHITHQDLLQLPESKAVIAAPFDNGVMVQLRLDYDDPVTMLGDLKMEGFSDGILAVVETAIKLTTLFIRISPYGPVYPRQEFIEKVYLGSGDMAIEGLLAFLCSIATMCNGPMPSVPKGSFKKALAYLQGFYMRDWKLEIRGERIYRYRSLKGLPYYEW